MVWGLTGFVMAASLLLVMILGTLLSSHLRIRELLIVFLVGVGLGFVRDEGVSIFGYSEVFVGAFAGLASGVAMFEVARRLQFGQRADRLALRPALVSVALHALVVGILARTLFFQENGGWWEPALVFALLMAGIDLFSVEIAPLRPKGLVAALSKEGTASMFVALLAAQALLFSLDPSRPGTALSAVVGIGIGLVLGLGLSRIYRHAFSPKPAVLGLYVAVLAALLASQALLALPAAAVAGIGLVVGHLRLKSKELLERLSAAFYHALAIFVIILAATLAAWPIHAIFYLKAVLLFAIHIVVRFLALAAGWWHHEPAHLWRIALIAPVGVPHLAIGLMAALVGPSLWEFLPLVLIFFVLSMATSAIGKRHLNALPEK